MSRTSSYKAQKVSFSNLHSAFVGSYSRFTHGQWLKLKVRYTHHKNTCKGIRDENQDPGDHRNGRLSPVTMNINVAHTITRPFDCSEAVEATARGTQQLRNQDKPSD